VTTEQRERRARAFELGELVWVPSREEWCWFMRSNHLARGMSWVYSETAQDGVQVRTDELLSLAEVLDAAEEPREEEAV
jgi:hypothetical protein